MKKIIFFSTLFISLFLFGVFSLSKGNNNIFFEALRTFKYEFLNSLPKYSNKDLNKIIGESLNDQKDLSLKYLRPFMFQDEIDFTFDTSCIEFDSYEKTDAAPMLLESNVSKISCNDKNRFILNLNGLSLRINKARSNFLNLNKRGSERGPTYIATHTQGDNLKFIGAQENGLFFSGNYPLTNVLPIKTNFHEFVDYFDFYGPGQFGIKDILIESKYLYVSYIKQVSQGCFNISIVRGKISSEIYVLNNSKSINFEEFFSPSECVISSSKEFNAHQSGGRLFNIDEDRLLFSTGDFRQRERAQSLDSYLGKVLSIDKSDQSFSILASGLRNPQGLFAFNKFEIVITDHGPMGGDEINFMNLKKKESYNFGWPISSYGAHYGAGSYSKLDEGYIVSKDLAKSIYKSFPLHESHTEYGYDEPAIYFIPSIGISQVVGFNRNDGKKYLIFGSMGYRDNLTQDDMSLYIAEIDPINEIKILKKIYLDERVRDIDLPDNQNNIIYLTGDSSGSIYQVLLEHSKAQ